MNPERQAGLEAPRTVNRLFYGLIAVCGLLLVAELFVHKHGHFAWENWFGFYAWFGYVVFTLIVLTGKQLRRLLRRDEDYYDR